MTWLSRIKNTTPLIFTFPGMACQWGATGTLHLGVGRRELLKAIQEITFKMIALQPNGGSLIWHKPPKNAPCFETIPEVYRIFSDPCTMFFLGGQPVKSTNYFVHQFGSPNMVYWSMLGDIKNSRIKHDHHLVWCCSLRLKNTLGELCNSCIYNFNEATTHLSHHHSHPHLGCEAPPSGINEGFFLGTPILNM